MQKLCLPFLLLLIACFSVETASAQYNWETTPAPAAATRYDDMVWRTPNLGFVIDYSGVLRKTTNGGQTWQQLPSPQGNAYRSMAFMTDQVGFIGKLSPANSTTLFRTQDGGQTWAPIPLPGVPLSQQGICGMSVVNEQVMYAAGRFNGPAYMYKTIDGGATWASTDMSLYAGGLIDCYFWSADSGLVVGHNGNPWDTGNAIILFTADGGQTWQNRHTTNRAGELCWKISFPSENVGYVSIYSSMGDSVMVLKTTDKGQTWQELWVATGSYYAEGIGFLNDSVGWIGGGMSPVIYQTLNGGQSWSQAPLGSFLNRFRFFGDSLGYASGAQVHKLDLRVLSSPESSITEPDRLLSAPVPNPANQWASAKINLPEAGPVKLVATDVLGRQTAQLYQNAGQTAGEQQIRFSVADLRPGMYLLRLQTPWGTQSQRMVICR